MQGLDVIGDPSVSVRNGHHGCGRGILGRAPTRFPLLPPAILPNGKPIYPNPPPASFSNGGQRNQQQYQPEVATRSPSLHMQPPQQLQQSMILQEKHLVQQKLLQNQQGQIYSESNLISTARDTQLTLANSLLKNNLFITNHENNLSYLVHEQRNNSCVRSNGMGSFPGNLTASLGNTNLSRMNGIGIGSFNMQRNEINNHNSPRVQSDNGHDHHMPQTNLVDSKDGGKTKENLVLSNGLLSSSPKNKLDGRPLHDSHDSMEAQPTIQGQFHGQEDCLVTPVLPQQNSLLQRISCQDETSFKPDHGYNNTISQIEMISCSPNQELTPAFTNRNSTLTQQRGWNTQPQLSRNHQILRSGIKRPYDAMSLPNKQSEEYDPAIPTDETSPSNMHLERDDIGTLGCEFVGGGDESYIGDGPQHHLGMAQLDLQHQQFQHQGNGVAPTSNLSAGHGGGGKRFQLTPNDHLLVTINRTGRSVSQETGQQPPRKSIDQGVSDMLLQHNSSVNSPYMPRYSCHACIVGFSEVGAFEEHMESGAHQLRMQEILQLQLQRTDRQLNMMNTGDKMKGLNGGGQEDYCRICDKRFMGTFLNHRKMQEHRRKERLTKRGCRLCYTGSFAQYPEYVKHIDSESHKKKKEELRRLEQIGEAGSEDGNGLVVGGKEKGDKPEEDDSSEISFPDSLEGMVTVDATGIYKKQNKIKASNDSDLEEGKKSLSPGHAKKPTETFKDDHLTRVNNETSSWYQSTKNGFSTNKNAAKGATEVLTYKPSETCGEQFVVPVTGFFCKICHIFYKSEEMARGKHCQSRLHFDNYKRAMNLTSSSEHVENPLSSSAPPSGDGSKSTQSQSEENISKHQEASANESNHNGQYSQQCHKSKNMEPNNNMSSRDAEINGTIQLES